MYPWQNKLKNTNKATFCVLISLSVWKQSISIVISAMTFLISRKGFGITILCSSLWQSKYILHFILQNSLLTLGRNNLELILVFFEKTPALFVRNNNGIQGNFSELSRQHLNVKFPKDMDFSSFLEYFLKRKHKNQSQHLYYTSSGISKCILARPHHFMCNKRKRYDGKNRVEGTTIKITNPLKVL